MGEKPQKKGVKKKKLVNEASQLRPQELLIPGFTKKKWSKKNYEEKKSWFGIKIFLASRHYYCRRYFWRRKNDEKLHWHNFKKWRKKKTITRMDTNIFRI